VFVDKFNFIVILAFCISGASAQSMDQGAGMQDDPPGQMNMKLRQHDARRYDASGYAQGYDAWRHDGTATSYENDADAPRSR